MKPIKPGPKPIADSTGKPDQRRRDNKDTEGNTEELKPSKSTKKKVTSKINERGYYNFYPLE